MHVALDRGEHDLSLRLDFLARRQHGRLFGFHERRQVSHGLLHHARRLDHLGQKHLARSEQVADHFMPSISGPFDDQQRAAQFGAGLLGVDIDVGIDALHQRMRQPLFDRAIAPLFGFLLNRTVPAPSTSRRIPPAARSSRGGG